MHDDFQPGPRKTAQEIARRAIILRCVVGHGQFAPDEVSSWLTREGLWDEVSPAERSLFAAENLTEQQRIDATWRSEALQVMLWSIGRLDALPPLTEAVKPAALLSLTPAVHTGTRTFIETAVLRSRDEIDGELDAIIHAHAKIRDQRTRRIHKAPATIPGVVLERQWALEWIENFDDVPWDEVTLSA